MTLGVSQPPSPCPNRNSENRTFPHFGNTKSGWRERKMSSLSLVASSSEWLLYYILKNLIVLRLVTWSFWSKTLIGCSGYDKSASNVVTSGNMMSTSAFKHFFSVARGRCHELLLRTVAGSACKPQSHTSWGWGTVRCSKALTFLSPQTSSRPSYARPSNIHDLLLRAPINASCLHRSPGVTSRLSSFLGYD
jgi:hypothetical protein